MSLNVDERSQLGEFADFRKGISVSWAGLGRVS